jgi:Domain of unknown function (DUF6438)
MDAVSKMIDRFAPIACFATLLLLPNRGYTAQKVTHEIVEISFETGGNSCGGPCADYKVTIRNDGKVTYQGRSNVRQTGIKNISVPRANFDLLARKINEIGFFNLRDRYDGVEVDGAAMSITDLPTRIVTVLGKAGAKKTIVDYWGTSKCLYELEQSINKLTTASILAGTPSDADDDLPYYDAFPMHQSVKFRGVISKVSIFPSATEFSSTMEHHGGSPNAAKWKSAYMFFLPKNVMEFELQTKPWIDLSQFDAWIVDATGKLTKAGVTGEHMFVVNKIQRVRRSSNFVPSK